MPLIASRSRRAVLTSAWLLASPIVGACQNRPPCVRGPTPREAAVITREAAGRCEGTTVIAAGAWDERGSRAWRAALGLLSQAHIAPTGETGMGWDVSVAASDAARAREILRGDPLTRDYVLDLVVVARGPWGDRAVAARSRIAQILAAAWPLHGADQRDEPGVGWSVSVGVGDAARIRAMMEADAEVRDFVVR